MIAERKRKLKKKLRKRKRALKDEDEEEHEEIYHEIEDRELMFKSDHEFSCESEKDESEDEDETFACKKCGSGDHPEWILLCDGCDDGYHMSCLRPALMVIPE